MSSTKAAYHDLYLSRPPYHAWCWHHSHSWSPHPTKRSCERNTRPRSLPSLGWVYFLKRLEHLDYCKHVPPPFPPLGGAECFPQGRQLIYRVAYSYKYSLLWAQKKKKSGIPANFIMTLLNRAQLQCHLFTESSYKRAPCQSWCTGLPGSLQKCWLVSKAAIIKYLKMDGLRNRTYCLTVLAARHPRSMCQQGWFLLQAVRENLFHASSWFPVVCWQSLAYTCITLLSLRLPMACHQDPVSPHACLCVQISPFHEDTSRIGLGPILFTFF